MSKNRSVEDILAILDIAIDNCLDLSSSNMSNDEKALLEKLQLWRNNFKIDNQTMHLLEAPMSDIDFKDILRQILKPLLDDLFETAKIDGVITLQEQKLLDRITSSFEL